MAYDVANQIGSVIFSKSEDKEIDFTVGLIPKITLPVAGEVLALALRVESQEAVAALVRQGLTGQLNAQNAAQLARVMNEGNDAYSGSLPIKSDGTTYLVRYFDQELVGDSVQQVAYRAFITQDLGGLNPPTYRGDTLYVYKNGVAYGGYLDWYSFISFYAGTNQLSANNIPYIRNPQPNTIINAKPANLGGVSAYNNVSLIGPDVSATLKGLNGYFSLSYDGQFSYNVADASMLPNGIHPTDSFTFDFALNADPGFNTFNIVVNRNPDTIEDRYLLENSGTISASSVAGVLANDFDLDGDGLQVVAVQDKINNVAGMVQGTYGVLKMNSDGSFVYNLTDLYFGINAQDSFKYTITDGIGFNAAYLHIDLAGINKDSEPLIDNLYYFRNNNDVWNARVEADIHYNITGWHEGRDPNSYFSTSGYLAANSDVRNAGVNPLQHYDGNGWREGRDPGANFDNELYLLHNPDVKNAGVDPLRHFLTFGQEEGRQAYAAIGRASELTAHPGFDAEYYLLANPDVARNLISGGGDTLSGAYEHYQNYGWREGRNPNAVFDTKGYLDAYQDVRNAGIDPLLHYDQFGWRENRDPSRQFDTSQYLLAYGDVRNAGIDPMLHYLQFGALEGRTAFEDGKFDPPGSV
ncbi:Ig-like domain-containing protein (plasmid) [Methylobacterium currus]|uniref:Ig-like domain-containing protein n=1 Tax=Methylobacterium currus TaxID=2051553 RepID=UPI001E530B48|nr:Ig-like domain-containing protein [Methylobacterium currus]UHC20487.1 Ig-like domain-containing protein [Methylobacterium currus]